MPKAEKTVFDETHYAILERLKDGRCHFPFREMKIYDGKNTLLGPNEIVEKSMQMAHQDLPLVESCGGDAYSHVRINPVGLACYKEVHVSDDGEFFTNSDECGPVSPKMSEAERIEAEKNLHELTVKLGL